MSAFARLVDEFFAFWWRMYPTAASAVGWHAFDGELERHDPATRAERLRLCRDYLRALEATAPADAGEALDRDLLADQLRWEIAELGSVRPWARNPAWYLEGPLNALYLMAVRTYAPAAERARRAAERLTALPRVLEDARENLTEPASIHIGTGIAMARSGIGLLHGILTLHLGKALEDDPAEFAGWENALQAAEAALAGYARWLEEEAAPRAGSGFALGRPLFEAKLRHAHGLPYTAHELLAYGEALKAETEAALAEVAAEIAPGRPWPEVAESLKAEHPEPDGLIGAYAEEVARARAFVVERELLDIPGGEELEVTATPEYLRSLIPYAAYQPPAPHETEQRGIFYVTPPPADRAAAEEVLRDHSVHGIPVTALHEAYPGHHLQFVRANRAETEPRRVFATPVFAEGWALYCEELMWEQGFYTDPRQRLLQLKDLLWRACRVVVDVGLHVRGWTPERAVEYMVREAGLERPNAEIEVRRYCAEPTQPLSYAVGKREILRLRERYQARRGAEFRLRDFHDRLLSWGTIPPPLVARALGLS